MKILSAINRFFKTPAARARNEAGERIESMRFTVPALRVGVLEYAPGQLQTNNAELDGKTVKLYYPPEAVSDEKFLKSLETAPVVVGGHNSTTNEQNKKIDGWAHTVNFDAAAKAAMIAGVVKGNKEVAYIKSNLGMNDFGASAFVDIFNMEIKSGITDDGQEYNAVAKDLRATHVALAPHVRDPGNKIRVTNAVCVNTGGEMVVENAGLREVEVTYSDGSKIRTNMAAGLSDSDIKNYYRIGQEFNIGSGGKDKVVKVKSVKILNAAEGGEKSAETMNIDVAAFRQAVKNAFEWYTDNPPKPSKKKPTAYGSWAEFEKKTGMTKAQYLAREKRIADELAEIEVNGSIYKGK